MVLHSLSPTLPNLPVQKRNFDDVLYMWKLMSQSFYMSKTCLYVFFSSKENNRTSAQDWPYSILIMISYNGVVFYQVRFFESCLRGEWEEVYSCSCRVGIGISRSLEARLADPLEFSHAILHCGF